MPKVDKTFINQEDPEYIALDQVSRFRQGLTDEDAEKWRRFANEAFRRCVEDIADVAQCNWNALDYANKRIEKENNLKNKRPMIKLSENLNTIERDGVEYVDGEWQHLIPYGHFYSWWHGHIIISNPYVESMRQNFNSRILGNRQPYVDVEHMEAESYGIVNELGWDSEGLWFHPLWTRPGYEQLKQGTWKNFSASWGEYIDNRTKEIYNPVLYNASLVNSPFMKEIGNVRLSSKIKLQVVPYKSYTVDEGEWDGPEEVAKADVDDLKIMATWYDEDNADIKASYKLPHHRAEGYAIVRAGVIASMGALLGARGGVDIPEEERRGVYNHLKRHYQEDLEMDPPEFQASHRIYQRDLALFTDAIGADSQRINIGGKSLTLADTRQGGDQVKLKENRMDEKNKENKEEVTLSEERDELETKVDDEKVQLNATKVALETENKELTKVALETENKELKEQLEKEKDARTKLKAIFEKEMGEYKRMLEDYKERLATLESDKTKAQWENVVDTMKTQGKWDTKREEFIKNVFETSGYEAALTGLDTYPEHIKFDQVGVPDSKTITGSNVDPALLNLFRKKHPEMKDEEIIAALNKERK